MPWYNKVSWSEGLFLRPQLFQQQERYLEHQAHLRCEPLGSLFWGFSSLAIEAPALGLGLLQLAHARGVWPDGLAFDIPRLSPPPRPLRVDARHLGQDIGLALPACTPQAVEVGFDEPPPEGARYGVFESELQDINSIAMGARSVQLLHLRMHLLALPDIPDGWMSLPLARVAAVHADGAVELDSRMIPPINVVGASQALVRWLEELHGHLGQRAAQIAQSLCGPSRVQAGDVADYLLLQLLNGHHSRLGHLLGLRCVAPERVHELLRALAAELCTYLDSRTRRPEGLPDYRHRDPAASFGPLLERLRALLHAAVRRGAEAIELQSQSHGLRVASVAPSLLREFSALVLAAGADLPADALAQQFVSQAKVGPADRLAELVRLHLPGIGLRALPVAPRQLPFHAGQVYFQLETDSALWQHMLGHGGIAVHMAVEFPGLVLQLWGVR